MNQHIVSKKRSHSHPDEEFNVNTINMSSKHLKLSNQTDEPAATSERYHVSTLSTFSVEWPEAVGDSATPLDQRNDFLGRFFANLKRYLVKTMPCDLTLLLSNGKRLNVHKLMLANSSAYFRHRIDQLSSSFSSCQETNEGSGQLGNAYTIKLNEIDDIKMLKVIIKFHLIYLRRFLVELRSFDTEF